MKKIKRLWEHLRIEGVTKVNEKNSSLTRAEKEQFMKMAILEAKKAEELMEVPIGAVIVLEGKIIGKGHNLREKEQDATAHAEMIAIREACRGIDNWRLEQAQLFVTLEPCPMCSGAMLLSRIEEVYYGASDPKGGTAGTLMNLLTDQRFNHIAYVESGILEQECGQLLSKFFKKLREEKKKKKKVNKD